MAERNHQLNLPPALLQSVSDESPNTPLDKPLAQWQAIPAEALRRSGYSQKVAALEMQKSESWVSRALRGLEKLGWSDIGTLRDPKFWQELIDLMIEFHDLGTAKPDPEREALAQAVVRELMKAGLR